MQAIETTTAPSQFPNDHPLADEFDVLLNLQMKRRKTVAPLEMQDVFYREQDNFTICCLLTKDGQVHLGAAKRHPKLDPKRKITGRRLALVRAAEDNV